MSPGRGVSNKRKRHFLLGINANTKKKNNRKGWIVVVRSGTYDGEKAGGSSASEEVNAFKRETP